MPANYLFKKDKKQKPTFPFHILYLTNRKPDSSNNEYR